MIAETDKTSIVDEIAYVNPYPQNAPTLTVVVRGKDFELVRGSAYFQVGFDRYGRYRIRRRTAVYLRERETETLIWLWDGAFTPARFRSHPACSDICLKLGLDLSETRFQRGWTLLVGLD